MRRVSTCNCGHDKLGLADAALPGTGWEYGNDACAWYVAGKKLAEADEKLEDAAATQKELEVPDFFKFMLSFVPSSTIQNGMVLRPC